MARKEMNLRRIVERLQVVAKETETAFLGIDPEAVLRAADELAELAGAIRTRTERWQEAMEDLAEFRAEAYKDERSADY